MSSAPLSVTDTDTHTGADTDTDTDTQTATDTAAPTATYDARDVLNEICHMIEQQLATALPSHMHALLRLISSYACPSLHTCWQPVPVADTSIFASSRMSGVPFPGWDVITGAAMPLSHCVDVMTGAVLPCVDVMTAVLPLSHCVDCADVLYVVWQVHFAQLPAHIAHVLGGATRMLQVARCNACRWKHKGNMRNQQTQPQQQHRPPATR